MAPDLENCRVLVVTDIIRHILNHGPEPRVSHAQVALIAAYETNLTKADANQLSAMYRLGLHWE